MELGVGSYTVTVEAELEVNIMMATEDRGQALSFTTSQQLEAEVEALNYTAEETRYSSTETVLSGRVCGSSAVLGTGQGNSDLVHLEQTKSPKWWRRRKKVALTGHASMLDIITLIRYISWRYGGGVTNNAKTLGTVSPTGAGAINKGSVVKVMLVIGYGSAGGSGLVLVGHED